MKTHIVSLFAGPGTGKSTSAAHIYARLKQHQINAELVTEWVKRWAWEGRRISAADQIYIMGKQMRAETVLLGKVPVIVTDSPVWLAPFYAAEYKSPFASELAGLIRKYACFLRDAGHVACHLWLTRSKPYVTEGRFQTEKEALQVDVRMRDYLTNGACIDFAEWRTDPDSLNHFVYNLKKALAA